MAKLDKVTPQRRLCVHANQCTVFTHYIPNKDTSVCITAMCCVFPGKMQRSYSNTVCILYYFIFYKYV